MGKMHLVTISLTIRMSFLVMVVTTVLENGRTFEKHLLQLVIQMIRMVGKLMLLKRALSRNLIQMARRSYLKRVGALTMPELATPVVRVPFLVGRRQETVRQ